MHECMVIGLRGHRLTAQERDWLRRTPPLGVILFARNMASPSQVRALIDDARQVAGRKLWAVVDEEGGRVHRMDWPPFNRRRPAAEHGERFHIAPGEAVDAVWRDALETGRALADLGFTHNCAPVLDVFHPSAHAVIGNRAWSDDVEAVCALGGACVRGLHDAGVEAVGKHFPGHGRADADSHLVAPSVDASPEIVLAEAEPFRRLAVRGLRHVMTAHVRYPAVAPEVATFSDAWIGGVLRRRFGFSGRVWSDDLAMKGAGGNVREAAAKARAAGCDVLLVCDPDAVRRVFSGGAGGGEGA